MTSESEFTFNLPKELNQSIAKETPKRANCKKYSIESLKSNMKKIIIDFSEDMLKSKKKKFLMCGCVDEITQEITLKELGKGDIDFGNKQILFWRVDKNKSGIKLTFPEEFEFIQDEEILSKRNHRQFIQKKLDDGSDFIPNRTDTSSALNCIKASLKKSKNEFVSEMIKEHTDKPNFIFQLDKLKEFLLLYFQEQPVTLKQFNFNIFEEIYIVLVLYKKKYMQWNWKHVDLETLRMSLTNKRKDHIFKFFIKCLLSTLAEENTNSTKKFQKKSFKLNNLSSKCLNNQFSFRNKLKDLFNENKSKGQNSVKCSNKSKMKLFMKNLFLNKKFSELVNKNNIDEILFKMFEYYKITRLKKHIDTQINQLRLSSLDLSTFFSFIYQNSHNKKFKSIWSYSEFVKGKEIFLSYM